MTLHRPARDLSLNGFGDFMRIDENGKRITLDGLRAIEVPVREGPPMTHEEAVRTIQSLSRVDPEESG